MPTDPAWGWGGRGPHIPKPDRRETEPNLFPKSFQESIRWSVIYLTAADTSSSFLEK